MQGNSKVEKMLGGDTACSLSTFMPLLGRSYCLTFLQRIMASQIDRNKYHFLFLERSSLDDIRYLAVAFLHIHCKVAVTLWL
mmetsp:Transcript_28747/g.42248  ORF Transcript_28747/g.42248 Transcript_28747/m.42248 type:complete len:82 (-) Transcript_28747:35-280(-)